MISNIHTLPLLWRDIDVILIFQTICNFHQCKHCHWHLQLCIVCTVCRCFKVQISTMFFYHLCPAREESMLNGKLNIKAERRASLSKLYMLSRFQKVVVIRKALQARANKFKMNKLGYWQAWTVIGLVWLIIFLVNNRLPSIYFLFF